MMEEKDILKEHITSDFKKEVPSIDFTEMVMQKVEASLNTKPVFEPLISKMVWIYTLIAAAIIVVLSFGLEVQQSEITWFSDLGIQLPDLAQFKTTITLSISITVVLGLMTTADLLYRKRRHVI